MYCVVKKQQGEIWYLEIEKQGSKVAKVWTTCSKNANKFTKEVALLLCHLLKQVESKSNASDYGIVCLDIQIEWQKD